MEPGTKTRSRRVEIRLSDEERERDQAAAGAVGESLSDFFRRAAEDRAHEILAERRRISLDGEEATRFLAALEAVDADAVSDLRELRARA
jgi:uncharacterized protein (DUF1778 family)